jgi:LacI family transcriptional regulator
MGPMPRSPARRPDRPTPPRGRVTAAQIGTACGLSQSAVSKILGHRANGFSPETIERVRAVALQLGYRPNTAARAMRGGRFGSIGLLTQERPAWIRMPDEVTWVVGEAVRSHRLQLTLGRVSDETLADDKRLGRLLDEWSVDGLIVGYTDQIPRRMFDLVRRYGVPTVWLNAKLEADCVHPDDRAAAVHLTEHLIRLGHRRIAYATHFGWRDGDHYSRADRYAGYADTMTAAGLQPWLLRTPPNTPEGDRARVAREQLTGADAPTAVMTYQNDTAVLWWLVARSMGLSVPGDLSLVSFHLVNRLGVGVPLTMMCYPAAEVGRAAVEAVLQKVEAPGVPLPPRVLPFSFDPGGTAGPRPEAGAPQPDV